MINKKINTIPLQARVRLFILALCVSIFTNSVFGFNFSQATKLDIKDARTVVITGYDVNNDHAEMCVALSNVGFSSWIITVLDEDDNDISDCRIVPSEISGNTFFFLGKPVGGISDKEINVQITVNASNFSLFMGKSLMNDNYDRTDNFFMTCAFDDNDSDALQIIINKNGMEALSDIENPSWKKVNLNQLKELFNQYFNK